MTVKWKAQWIWHPEAGGGKNDFVYFRKTFPLEQPVVSALLYVTAEREYHCSLDGELIGRGPVLGDPQFKRYDCVDITAHLTTDPLEHVLAFTVYHDEAIPFYPLAEARGLLFQLELVYADGRQATIVSDKTVKVFRSKAYNAATVFNDRCWAECYNANLDANDWKEAQFDDSPWFSAVQAIKTNELWGNVKPQYRFIPWIHLVPREIPLLRRKIHWLKVVQAGEVLQTMQASADDTAVRMSLEPILPLSKAHIENEQALENEAGQTVVMNSNPLESFDTFDGIRNATIVLDCGQLLNGRLSLELETASRMTIDIGFGTVLNDGKASPYVSARTRHADQYIARSGRQTWINFNWRHFRYVQLTFRDVTEPVVLHKVWVEEQQYPYVARGQFVTDVDVINRIYRAADRTIRLCTADRFMDNPTREMKQFAGDCATAVPAVLTLYGNDPILKKYFRQFKETQYRTGSYRNNSPGNGVDNSMLIDHSLLLLFHLTDYYQYTADGELISEMWGGIVEFIRLMCAFVNERGLLDDVPYDVFLDWAHIHREGEILVLNAIFAEVLRRFASLGERLGLQGEYEQWKQKAAIIATRIREDFYDGERGVFVDCIIDGVRSERISEHGNSVAMLFDGATDEQKQAVLKYYSMQEEQFVKCSPGWMFWAYAMHDAGRTDMAMQWIERRFGKIVQKIDTLPELWNDYADNTRGVWRTRNSRARTQIVGGWIAHFLVTQLVGITPAAPGFSGILFKPRLHFLQHCQVQVPIADGDVQVSYETHQSGEITYRLQLPSEKAVAIDLGILAPETAVNINGAAVELSGGVVHWERVREMTIRVSRSLSSM